MTGCLYGIGVGPGDPELMTIKAARLLSSCQVLAIPHESKECCTAYQIAAQAVPQIREKLCLCLPMPMTKDKHVLKKSHDEAAGQVKDYLKEGKDVAFITLGDVTVYSTYQYLHERIKSMGYRTGMVNGIPSFCAASALLGHSLVGGREELHIIPATYGIENALELPGVKVLMKAGKAMPEIKEQLCRGNYEVHMVENCHLAGERIFHTPEELPEDAGYYSLMIVRDKKE